MTLYDVVKYLKTIALAQPNIKTAKDGNIYNILNANPSVKYAAFIITQNTHRTTENFDYYGFTLFYADRLMSDMEDNRLEIQSQAKQALDNIIRTFCNNMDIDLPTMTFTPWTEKFADELAGMYIQVEFVIPIEFICNEEF